MKRSGSSGASASAADAHPCEAATAKPFANLTRRPTESPVQPANLVAALRSRFLRVNSVNRGDTPPDDPWRFLSPPARSSRTVGWRRYSGMEPEPEDKLMGDGTSPARTIFSQSMSRSARRAAAVTRWGQVRPAFRLALRREDRLELFFERRGHGQAFDDHAVQSGPGDRV
jgi:hypothetical protein